MMQNKSYLSLNIKLMQLTGLYKAKGYGIRVRRYICNFSMIYGFTSFIVDLMKRKHLGFNEVAINILNAGIVSIVLFTGNYFYFFVDKSEKLVATMNKIFKYSTNNGFAEMSVQYFVHFTYYFTWTWVLAAFVFGETYGIGKLIFGGYHTRTFPYPQWYPYNATVSPYFELTSIQQIASHGLLNLMFCSIDCFYACIMILTVGQFELLGWEFENVLYKSLLQCGISKESAAKFKKQFNCIHESFDETKEDFDEIHTTLESEYFTIVLQKNFNSLIRFHQGLIKFCEELNDFFSPVMLMYILNIMFIMLFTLYFFVTIDDVAVRVTVAGYVVVIPANIFYMCVFGNILISKNEEVLNQLYGMPWYHCNKKIKSSFLIVQKQIQEPPVLSIGKFAQLNLQTFIWVMKSSFSYTTFLRQMTNKTPKE